jgi:predicted phage terminase large subunit-like protein
LGFEPDPWQRDLLISTDERVILNCSRQSGKSTAVAILALHHALTTPSSVVLIISPSLRQSELLFEKIGAFYRQLGRPGGSDAHSATTLKLRNGSRILALPGSESTTRGFSPSMVLVDEAARVSEELYYSDVRPMLAVSRGRLILLSTPHGKQGIFWHVWDQEPDWKKIKITADQCPRILKEFLDQERRTLPNAWFEQEYRCEFVQEEGSIFKESWIQFFDPEYVPYMDTVIQAWDTAQTKSSTSDFTVGQVWGKIGADFYLLDQVRGRWDFDETVAAMKDLLKHWPQSRAEIVEAQTLGAALSSHLKDEVPGIIPIHVKRSKEMRALNCVPVWRSKNVYIPKPDDGDYAWVHDYLAELLNFPTAVNDDQVDATTLALNQLQGSLFPASTECVASDIITQPLPERYYFIGWIPARQADKCTVLVFDLKDYTVVHFERYPAEPVEEQILRLRYVSSTYNGAVVRAFSGVDEALLHALESEGVYVQRIKLTRSRLAASYEHLNLLMRKKLVTFPDYRGLLAELDVFKSDFTFNEGPDYSLQVAQQSAIHALCLVTLDLDPPELRKQFTTYYSYDPDLL